MGQTAADAGPKKGENSEYGITTPGGPPQEKADMGADLSRVEVLMDADAC